ncbi:MAG: NAD-dependent epimerase/dehydratase family protein [archaeon]
MKILVTGGAGFIGSHIVDLLVREHEVLVIDNLSSGKKKNINPRARFYQSDLSDYTKIGEIFENEKPEVVYHLAAQIDVRKSLQNPVYDANINIINTINLLEMCIKYNIKHFIFSSTGGAIYGDTKEIPTPESHSALPVSPYGCAKLSIEKYLNYYNKVHNLKYTILRYSNVYGPRQNPEGEAGAIAIFLDQMFQNKNSIIFGGIQTRDFVYVRDVARANLLALNDDKSETYNISSGKEIDIIELYSKLNKYFNNKFTPEFKELRKGEQMKSCLSYEKIKNFMGWQPEIKLDDGLDRTYCWSLKEKQT